MTIEIPAIAVTIGTIVITVPTIVIIAITQVKKRCRKLKLLRRLQKQREQDLERVRVEELLPPKWLAIYDACKAAGDRDMRAIWFETWFDRRKNNPRTPTGLPLLSMPAIKIFAEMVNSYNCKNIANRMSCFLSINVPAEMVDSEKMTKPKRYHCHQCEACRRRYTDGYTSSPHGPLRCGCGSDRFRIIKQETKP